VAAARALAAYICAPRVRRAVVLLALGWGMGRDWLAEVEAHAAAVVAIVRQALGGFAAASPRRWFLDDRAPRHLFGLVFESRPPPLLA